MAEVKDQIAQVAVQRSGIGLILPQDSQHLAVGAGGTVAVHKISQQLLALAALEGERTSAHKDLKVAEALDLDAHRCRFRRVAQIFQHIAHIGLVGGLSRKPLTKICNASSAYPGAR